MLRDTDMTELLNHMGTITDRLHRANHKLPADFIDVVRGLIEHYFQDHYPAGVIIPNDPSNECTKQAMR